MCGIAGIINFNNPVNPGSLRAMAASLQHRGPDGEWFWQSDSGKEGFAYRRLAILDKAAFNHEPLIWKNKFLVLFNGEIYNYPVLKKELITKGFQFKTQTDAEIIPALYELYGTDCVNYINGMFAFAIWDIDKQELFAARDRFGEKPFFYYKDKEQFIFASEMKALWAAGVKANVDERMLFNYLVYNVVENTSDITQTFYKNIKRLAPASTLTLKNRETKISRYWTLPSETKYEGSLDSAAEVFRGMLQESVQQRLHSDVPLGLSISGGLDSSAVYTMARKSSEKPIPTFSARIHDTNLDEGPYIDSLLQRYPAENHATWVTEDLILQSLPKILYHQEEPIADLTALAQWMLMEKTKETGVTVLLDGQGADEMLAGYIHLYGVLLKEQYAHSVSSFRDSMEDFRQKRGTSYPIDMKFFGEIYFPGIMKSVGNIRRGFTTPGYFSFLNNQFIAEYKHKDTPFPYFNNLQQALHYRTTQYGLHKLLRYADRNSMAHGIEVRFPFLDHKLVEFIFSLPSSMKIYHGWTKYLLRVAMDKDLPSSINWRVAKLGYQTPTKEWLQHPRVKEMIRDAQHQLALNKIIKPDLKLDDREATAVLIASHFIK